MSVRTALAIAAFSVATPTLAAAPARPYDVQHYRLDLRLLKDGAFENTARITLVPSKSLAQVELDSYGLDIQAVTLEGAEVRFTLETDDARRTGVLTLKPKRALPPKKAVTFEVHYKGKAATANEGFFRTEGGYLTHFQAEFARRFVPSNDRPDDKATVELHAVVDAKYTVLSSGEKSKDETFTEKGEHLRRVQWTQATPIPLYSFAVAVGAFEPVDVGSSVTPATLWVQPGTKDRAFVASDATFNALSFQQAFLGVKYPWKKYDQVAVPRFIWGGMENTSLVMMRENGLVLEDRNHLYGRQRIVGLIAHELAHQWFGDYVTCRSFRDVWLNEGFATFLGEKTEDASYENDQVEVSRAVDTFVSYFREEDGPRSHPLVAKKGLAAEGEFDSTSYTKGAHVLRMLEHWVGPAQFKKGLKAYLEKYAHGNADSEDFFATFMKATGTEKELRAFRDAWLYKRGYPVITPQAEWNGSELEVTITQRPNHADEKGAFVFKLPVVFHRDGEPSYAKEQVIVVDKPVVKVKVALPARPSWINWNQDGTALARIHAPAISEEMWTLAARHDPDPVWRTLAAFVLLDPMMDARAKELKTPSVAATDALHDVLKKDGSPYVREAVLQRLADVPFKRLPERIGDLFLELAQRPSGLPEDAIGMIRVRRAALAALGKVEHKAGRQYLLEQVMKQDLDLNFLPAVAEGTARLGDPEALASLGAAVTQAKARGYPYYRQVSAALGSVTTPEVLPLLGDLLRENAGNNELLTGLHRNLSANTLLLTSPEFAGFVRGFVLEDGAFDHALKGRMLSLLDEVTTKEAKEALLAIARGAPSERIKQRAEQVLNENFPGALSKKGGKK
ncbi:MAG: M1 family aminopeptidase [Myxococcaceae bacterium]